MATKQFRLLLPSRGTHCLFRQLMRSADEGKSAGEVFVALLRDEFRE
jgi:hypothetical protein